MLLGLLVRLKLDPKHLAEVLAQVVRRGALDALPGLGDESLRGSAGSEDGGGETKQQLFKTQALLLLHQDTRHD